MKVLKNTRREFIKTTAATATVIAFSPNLIAKAIMPNTKSGPICLFTKCLQFKSYDQLGEILATVGFKGADLTVRPTGHVLPENVKEDLPKALKSLKKSGISVPMIVTRLKDPDHPYAEQTIATASELGIKYYRIGPLKYDWNISMQENFDNYKRVFEKFEKLNEKYDIHGCYQNHPGMDRVGAAMWDTYLLIKDCNPKYIGVQYDIGQAVMEQSSCWPQTMHLLAPWIKTSVMKDFYWQKREGKWEKVYTPLGTGMVDFDMYFKNYIKLGISGPITIHLEYDLGGAENGIRNPTMSKKEILDYMKKDLKWCQDNFEKNGII